MDWNLEAGRPVYAQIVEKIQMQIVSGQYAPGQRLPSVRELAAEAAVNPNTMQKAFAELERSGLIVTHRTSGRMVTEDGERILALRRELAGGHVRDFLDRMESLGFAKEDILQLVKERCQAEGMQNRTAGTENNPENTARREGEET